VDTPDAPLSQPIAQGGQTALKPAPAISAPAVKQTTTQAVRRDGKVPQRGIPPHTVAEPAPTYVAEPEWDEADVPPPPDAFPPGWDDAWQPDFEAAQMASRPEPKFKKSEPVSLPPEVVPAPPPEPEAEASSTPEIKEATSGTKLEARPGMVVQAVEAPANRTAKLPSLYAPIAQAEDRTHPPQQITVFLRPTGDHDRDKRRIKILHGTLISFHGRDKFTFQIFENGKGHLIDFPNDTTRVCPEVLARLKNLMGEENWRIEEITYQ